MALTNFAPLTPRQKQEWSQELHQVYSDQFDAFDAFVEGEIAHKAALREDIMVTHARVRSTMTSNVDISRDEQDEIVDLIRWRFIHA